LWIELDGGSHPALGVNYIVALEGEETICAREAPGTSQLLQETPDGFLQGIGIVSNLGRKTDTD